MKEAPIYAPLSFWNADEPQIKETCNGCGAKGGIKVPDTMWFLSITLACQVHDWMFKEGKTLGDFFFANAIFLFNLTAIIINGSNFLTILPRIQRATKYFLATMSDAGRKAYWVEKEENDIITITYKGSFKKMGEIQDFKKGK